MEEEIDIIELLKRVKEGKAPKKIQISATRYELNCEPNELKDMDIGYLYVSEMDERAWIDDTQPEITIQTKIKILDKPIIEEIPLIEIKHDYSNGSTNDTYEVERAITNGELADKINEIIRYINAVSKKKEGK